MASNTKKVVLTGYDLIKGKTTNKTPWYTNLIDMSPWQMIPEEDKTEEWVMWNADWFEQVGYNQVLRKNRKIMKNRRLSAGLLDMEDYLIYPEMNQEYGSLLQQLPGYNLENPLNLLQQYFPVIPNVISTLSGEFLQMDNRMIVRGVDDFTLSERVEYKENLFKEALVQSALQEKQMALLKMGIIPSEDNPEATQQYQDEMQKAQQMAEVESKSKKFVTSAEIWGQHVIDSARYKFNMIDLELENFKESLMNAEEYWHLDLKENDFTVEILDGAYAFEHQNYMKKYGSEGDFIGWFTFNTIGDIIDKYGERMTAEQLESLRDVMTIYGNMPIVPNHEKNFPGAYYDTSKPWPQGKTDNNLNDLLVAQNLIRDFSSYNNNTTHVSANRLFNSYTNPSSYGMPHLFRVMRLYWKSQRAVSFLTKVDRSGAVVFQDWVDENFKVTVEPIYDNSILQSKTAENLIYGEHLEKTYTNDWRHVIKIAPNTQHQFWRTYPNFNSIYLDGAPVKFQFKGPNDIYEALPPVEVAKYRTMGLHPISLVDRMKPWALLANVSGNKTTEIISKDLGLLVSVNKQMIPRNTSNEEADYGDPLTQYFNNMQQTGILDYTTSREQLESFGGQAIPPQIVNASRIQEAQQYFNLHQLFKMEAMATIGLTRERTAQAKPTQTATAFEQGMQYSESQTLELYHQHSKTMERVYQRIIEATQYYSTFVQTSTVSYLNTKEENIFIQVAAGELHKHFNVRVQSDPRLKSLEQQFRQLLLTDNTMGANALEKAEALFAGSSVEILEKMKEIHERTIMEQQAQQQQEQQMQQQQIEANQEIEKMRIDNENLQKQLDRESEERIASIRAMGGIQTDVDENNVIDSRQNIDSYIKMQQAQQQASQAQQQLLQQQQQHLDNLLIEREKTNAKLKETKMKTDAQKYVADKNKNRFDSK